MKTEKGHVRERTCEKTEKEYVGEKTRTEKGHVRERMTNRPRLYLIDTLDIVCSV